MINWQQIANNLRGYKPLATVAREIDSTEKHLNRLARGEVKEPRFNTGLKLLDLHLEQFPEKHNEGLYIGEYNEKSI